MVVNDVEPYNVKISDFVHCQYVLNNKYSSLRPTEKGVQPQTQEFRAPEVIIGVPYSYPIDMWSVGIIACFLYYRKSLFYGQNNYEIVSTLFLIFCFLLFWLILNIYAMDKLLV